MYFSVFGVFGAGEDNGDTGEPAGQQEEPDVSAEQTNPSGATGATPDTENPGTGAAGPGFGTSGPTSNEPTSEDSTGDEEDENTLDKVMNIFGFVSIGSEDSSSETGS